MIASLLKEFQYSWHSARWILWSAFGVSLMYHATSCTVAVLSEYSGSNLGYKMIEGPSRAAAGVRDRWKLPVIQVGSFVGEKNTNKGEGKFPWHQ